MRGAEPSMGGKEKAGQSHDNSRDQRGEATMSAIFDGYEREYCELSTQLGRKTGMLKSLSGGKQAPTPRLSPFFSFSSSPCPSQRPPSHSGCL